MRRGGAILRTSDGGEFPLNGVTTSRGIADISGSDVVVPGEVEATHRSTGDLTAAAIELLRLTSQEVSGPVGQRAMWHDAVA